jgi:hypothetical protein
MGTAVMVDTLGVPRARCAGFNPLGAAKPASSPKYRGEKWEAFEPTKLVIVGPGDHVDTFEVVDMHSRQVIEIATGSSCICDHSTASTTTTTSSTTSTTLRGGSTTTRVTVRSTTTSRPATTTTRPTTTTAPTTTVPPTTTTAAP